MASVNVFVDDTDPRITYNGPWSNAPGPTADIGFYGPAWNNTLHATQANASLSFAFHGIWAVLYTTSTTPAGLTGPRYQCFVDGVQQSTIGIADSTGPTNHWATCGGDTLADGPHVFTVNVTLAANETAWVDFIKYAPSADVSLANETVLVQNFSPDIKFGAGWGPLPVSADNVNPWSSSTNVTGSTFGYNFIGSSVIWYALATTFIVNNPAPCTYAIDGGTPISFKTVGLSSRNPTQNEFFVLLFETDTLNLGPHTLDVVYNGGVNDTPLILDYLIIQNRTTPSFINASPISGSGAPTTSIASQTSSNTASAANSSGTQVPASNTAATTQTTKHTNIGAIVGGVCAGVALILVIALLLLCLRRRQKRHQKDEASAQPHAFMLPQAPASPSFGISHNATEHNPSQPSFVGVANGMASRPTLESSFTKRPFGSGPLPLPALSSASASHAASSSASFTQASRPHELQSSLDSKSVPMRDAGEVGGGDVPPPMYTPD